MWVIWIKELILFFWPMKGNSCRWRGWESVIRNILVAREMGNELLWSLRVDRLHNWLKSLADHNLFTLSVNHNRALSSKEVLSAGVVLAMVVGVIILVIVLGALCYLCPSCRRHCCHCHRCNCHRCNCHRSLCLCCPGEYDRFLFLKVVQWLRRQCIMDWREDHKFWDLLLRRWKMRPNYSLYIFSKKNWQATLSLPLGRAFWDALVKHAASKRLKDPKMSPFRQGDGTNGDLHGANTILVKKGRVAS